MSLPFKPANGQTVSISVGTSSANVQVTAGSGLTQVRIYNDGTATAWIKHGTTNAVAAVAASDIPVGPGVTEVLTFTSPVYLAAIAAGSTGSVYFTPGEGD